MRAVGAIVDRIANTDATVLVRGESGVGKDLVARAIHGRSIRRHGPFVRVNCAAIPPGLLESELLGHERGAFTGATQRKRGQFEYANRGTIYLDEIGDLSLELQAKLLHVLQDLRFSRVGGHALVEVDARVIAATNRDLETAMARLEFREDLYYRLNVVDLRIPSLRERREEIPRLAAWFLDRFNARYGRQKRLSAETLALLEEHAWPGNVRELENTVRRMVLLADAEREFAALAASARRPRPAAPLASDSEGLREIARRAAREAERAALVDVLERVRWNRLAAARILAVSYKTMLNKITEYRLIDKNARPRTGLAGPVTSAGVLPALPPSRHAGSNLDAK
ncbi:MAG: sigma-54 interaction domain-containing protein [Candidatus Rokuibacteriota bacterium]